MRPCPENSGLSPVQFREDEFDDGSPRTDIVHKGDSPWGFMVLTPGGRDGTGNYLRR